MFTTEMMKSASAHHARRILWLDFAHLRRVLRLALLVLVGVTPVFAHANIACEVANISLTLSAGTISVPVGAPVGQTLASLTPSTFQMSCHFVNRVNNVTAATNYANFATTQLAPGFTDVYQTNIAGIGVRYTFDSAQCNAAHVVVTNGQAQVGCYFSGPLDGPYQNADITVTPTLVVTGTIAPGTRTLSTVPVVTITYTESDQNTSWNKGSLYTGAATGQFVHATCSINQSNVYVYLPNSDTKAFASGIGAVTASQAFQLSLACASGAKVLITLTDSVNPANRTNTLTLSNDSTAQGVGIQVLNSAGTAVSFGADSAAPGNTNQWVIGDSPDGTLQVPLSARYVRTGTVSSGSVKALATFTMSYQ
ncbi:type 1 fimbrial protein [Paraburkholderia sp. LEh10]|uniref:fimbrial protein n=1 Tax=Paraburkholderia sp. LEh10 TaxID=2821353 RepID=UPI001AE2752C|nr:fimbrial protein [Paraburkholderia sp. LEh10]MBP0592723.1 type 1 fimbrial protein [Paraburkholderia sp. LEh10]